MRKLFFVLLSTLLIAFTGCQSGNTPDAAVSSLPSEGAESVSGASSTDTSHSEVESSEELPASSAGDTSTTPSSNTAENPSSTGRPDTAGTASQKPTISAEQKPTATPEQTNPPESTNGNTSSAATSSNLPVTEPSREEPLVPEASDQPEPTTSQPPETTSQPDMEAEYARIIRETVAYAEGYTAKGFTFIWDNSLEFSWESGAGWMGTPRVKYEGVDGTIEMLKYHIDKIVKTSTDPGNGIPSHSANYKVMQVTVDGDIAFVVLYG